jgi:hypothetical protein
VKTTNLRRIIAGTAIASAFLLTGFGCASDADRANDNLSTKAEHFEIQRQIVGVNTRSDKVLFSYEGRCSLESDASKLPGFLQISCKHGPDDYRTHFERLTPETAISSHQLGPIDVSVYHTDIRFKPEQLVPEISVETGTQ